MTITLSAFFKRSPPVDLQPVVNLAHWCIVLTPFGTAHFIGVLGLGGCFRVSSPVIKFDPDSLIGYTLSGREYHLVAEPAGEALTSVMLSLMAVSGATVVDPTATDATSTLLGVTNPNENSRFSSAEDGGDLI